MIGQPENDRLTLGGGMDMQNCPRCGASKGAFQSVCECGHNFARSGESVTSTRTISSDAHSDAAAYQERSSGDPPSALWIVGLIVVVVVTAAVGQGTNQLALISVWVFFPAAIALYFAPSIVARQRGRANQTSILILNLFLGWTLLGWVVALVWAFSEHERQDQHPEPAQDTKTCPYCAEDILSAAIKCRYCGSDLREVDPLVS